MTSPRPESRTRLSLRAPLAFAAAAVVGLVHSAFTLYWAAGGEWLLSTLGPRIVEAVQGHRWITALVGVIEAVVAVLPLAVIVCGGPLHRFVRAAGWAGGVLLVLWCGGRTVLAHLVLAGVLPRGVQYGHDGVHGNAWLWDPLFLLWDPLFLLWGVALLVGLLASRPGHAWRAISAAEERILHRVTRRFQAKSSSWWSAEALRP